MSKRLRLLAFFYLILSSSILSQSDDLHVYRVHVKNLQEIEKLRQFNFTIVGTNFGKWVDLICAAQDAKKMETEGLFIEKIDADALESTGQTGLGGFHSYAETREFLHQIANDFPQITHLDSIGASVENRGIWALKISDNPKIVEDEPCLLVEGCIHGNENHALEVCLYFIQYLVENYGKNSEVTHWVENREIWVVPLVNPDGHEKNQRYNANKVDLNRNFGYWWGFTASRYGTAPFSEPETQAIRDLVIRIKPYGSLAFHTSGRVILYPWAYTSSPLAPDDALFQETAKELVDSINTVDPNIQYNYRRSGTWYWHGGEHNDWMYSQYGMLSFTIELMTSQSALPSEHENEVVLPAFRVMLRRPDRAGITGKITDASTGLPVAATFKIKEIFDENQLLSRKSDSTTGRFIRFLPAGNFIFEAYAPGYAKFIKNISVNRNDSMQTCHIALRQGPDLVVKNCVIYDSGIGAVLSNGILNRGETAQLNLQIENIGSLNSTQVMGNLQTTCSEISLIETNFTYDDVASGEVKFANNPVTLIVSEDAKPGQKICFQLKIRDLEGNQWDHSFYLRVQGFSDNMEDEGRDQWTHGTFGNTANHHDDWQYGIPNGERGDPSFAHSGQFVWGNDLGSGSWNGAYQNNQHNYFRSRPIDCTGWQNVYLQFYRWLRVADGDEAYIKVNNQVVWSNFNSEIKDQSWNLQILDISSAAADSDSVVIVFCLKSNNSGTSSGWTIDDVLVDEEILLSVNSLPPEQTPEKYQLLPNYPNPFQNFTQIRFSLTKRALVDLTVYNVLGQKVRTIVRKKLSPGNYLFPWNGLDDRNQIVSTGVYIIQLKADQYVLSNKIMHVRDE